MIYDISPVNTYNGNNLATTFDFDFYIENKDQLKVTYVDENDIRTVLSYGVDYSINEFKNPQGSYITYPIEGSSHTILKQNEKIVLELTLPISQETEYNNSSLLNLEALEYSFDYLTRICQIQDRQLQRAVKIQEGSNIATDTLAQNINKVADINTDISIVAGIASDVTAVKDNAENITTVSASIENVDAVGESIANVNAVADDLTNIDNVADDLTNIDTVSGISQDISTVSEIASDVTAVKNNATNINLVATDLTKINAVADDLTNIDSVADDLTAINAVNSNKTNIDTVAGILTDISTVAGIASDITSVKNISSDIEAVADDLTSISAVADDLTNIDSIASDLTNIDSASSNAQLSKDWANKMDGSVDGVEFSAKYYAQQASQNQVQANWNESDSTSKAYIQNKPTLSTVATSGSYNDLINKPSFDKTFNVLSGSGTVNLVDNSVNVIVPVGDVVFNLPTITDNTIYHKILVQMTLNSNLSIDIGTEYYIKNNNYPNLGFNLSTYNLTYEYDKENQYWVCKIEEKVKEQLIKQLAFSNYTTWILFKDGTLWGCGLNNKGQQSIGTSGSGTDVTTFEQKLTNVKKIKCSDYTTWVIKNDNTLWGCGQNDKGQQGSGDTNEVTTFTQRLTDVKDIDCFDNTTWALKTDNTLWGCGLNNKGQQGSGDTSDVLTFTQRLTDVKEVMCGQNVTWALKTDNTLWGCGNNPYGQQGSGDTNNVTTFTQRLTDVKKFTCKTYETTWALKTDNTLWGCGNNTYGQQGSGDTTSVTTFTQRLTDVKDIPNCFNAQNAGSSSMWALKTDNTLWGCGNNINGQQGIGTSGSGTNVNTFTQRLTDVKEVAITDRAIWVIKNDNTLWGCGSNTYAQQGSGDTSDVTTFTQRLTDVKEIYALPRVTWVLKSDITLWGCGHNNQGQQGNGTTTIQTTFEDKSQYYI